MSMNRIIPQLHIKGPMVVKPIHTEALRIVGEPIELAKRYYRDGADEIIFLDIVASLYGRNPDLTLIEVVSNAIFVPLTVGGGIRTIHDIAQVLRAGADKIAINTHAIKNPPFLKEAVEQFGAQCIVLFIEAKNQGPGKWEAYTDGGRERTGCDVIDWVKRALDFGVGEFLVTSIDRDGTRRGYDLELVRAITAISPVPVIAHGGAGTKETFKDVLIDARADAVAASSVFHYRDYSIAELKNYLRNEKIDVRL